MTRMMDETGLTSRNSIVNNLQHKTSTIVEVKDKPSNPSLAKPSISNRVFTGEL